MQQKIQKKRNGRNAHLSSRRETCIIKKDPKTVVEEDQGREHGWGLE